MQTIQMQKSRESVWKAEFKGKQDLLVHLRALVVLESYCPRLNNPGMWQKRTQITNAWTRSRQKHILQ